MSKNGDASESELLKLLSVNSRIGIDELAQKLHVSKSVVASLLEQAKAKYGITFVPELSFDNLWHMEFARQARMQTKRGIIGEASEIIANTGFNEYALQINFLDKAPSDKELADALGDSYIVQFLARTKGKYDIWAYLVSRTYEEIRYMLEKMNKKLGKYSMTESVSRIWTEHGFFPISAKLVQQFNLFDSYKNLILGLLENGRRTFSEIGGTYAQGSTQMIYAYDRLIKTNVIKRMTYYESTPERRFGAIAQITVTNQEQFEKSKEAWYTSMVKQDEEGECLYTYIASTMEPMGSIAIINTKTNDELKGQIDKLSSMQGASVSYSLLQNAIIGKIGIRNFDMRYSDIYAYLESRNKVARFEPRLSKSVEEAPDFYGANERQANWQ